MSQAKQTLDSYSVFLKNVRKKRDKTEPAVKTQNLNLEILQDLENQGPMPLADLGEAHDLTISETVLLLGQLQNADMLTIDTKTDLVSLTDFGHRAAKLKDLVST